MAKQKGIIPLAGTLGGLNFYYLNGKPVVRQAGGGFNSKAIKTKDSMQRVRENGNEFGHCSHVNKVFKHALSPFYMGCKLTYLHSRLMRLFTQLKDLDLINKRGQRVVAEGIKTFEGLQLLKQFQYTPECEVQRILPFNFILDAHTFTLTISEFDIKHVGFVAGATHVKLSYGVLDFNFNALVSQLFMAPPLILDKEASITSILLTPQSLPTGLGIPLCVLGLRFYQNVDGTLYELCAQNTVGFRLF
ncbi:hypothetical protein QLS71_014780 [Mariniflexile litorale]|uniref:Uncharacterized protein n=1 Tax=Mariniflexile litorale TaxID=3045158 RepID=A0AAU7EDC6_9FLAO|nr:hypothetical protein [Mariniflexile sp. KMM 9835]MDQ8212811.1 hypothetical protein [Mariniflexile sp. KMM 9835]